MQNKFTIGDVKEFWDKAADSYIESHKKIKDIHFQRFSEAVKYMDPKPNLRILNVWARIGEAIPKLRDNYKDAEIINLEASSRFIEIASRIFPNETFRQTDLASFPCEDNYFDYIVSLETLEHAPDPLKFLRECYRVLKSDGTLILSCPPASIEIPVRIYKLFFGGHGEGPHKFLSSGQVKRLLEITGFKLISHKGTLLFPIGPTFLKIFGERLLNRFQNTPLKEFGIRQFYVCKKKIK